MHHYNRLNIMTKVKCGTANIVQLCTGSMCITVCSEIKHEMMQFSHYWRESIQANKTCK